MIKWRRQARGVLGALLLLLVIAVSYWVSNYKTQNFHTVIPGKIYRSAQLSPAQLAWVIQHKHIRTVINLRGAEPDEAWYRGEIATTARYHVLHQDLAFDAHHLPQVTELQRLAFLLQNSPQPVLLHCRQGADRTGMASAMALLLLSNASSDEIWRQVSFVYNVVSPSSVGYQMLRDYQQWCEHEHVSFDRQSFLQWLQANPPLPSQRGFSFPSF